MLTYAPPHARSAPAPTGAVLTAPVRRLPVLLDDGAVTPLRRRDVVALGGLASGQRVSGGHLVPAVDVNGLTCWVPAAAVWVEVAGDGRPGDQPVATGLATARSWSAAMLAGLSDRLGWEAVLHLDGGGELSPLAADRFGDTTEIGAEDVTVLDGRIGHDVPTVVVLGPGVARWGAGRTWARALRRALFGTAATDDQPDELAELADRLGEHGLRPVRIDVGSEVMRSHGITRTSVQLVTR